jgi:enoyl-CoA hydratase/carnithine racemase
MILIERKNGIAVMTLNRPGKRNALHPDLLNELSNRLAEVEKDADISVVVLTGAGSTFCSGLDLSHLSSLDAEGRIEYLRLFLAVFSQLYRLIQPVIAAINGPAIAGGFDLAAACDLRLSCREARFGQTEVVLGLTQMLYPIYKTIGIGVAKELALTGELISAADAYRIGFVNRVSEATDLVSEAMKMAELLASRPRNALFATKKLSRELLDANTDSAMRLTLQAITERLASEEHRTALAKYLAGRHAVER